MNFFFQKFNPIQLAQ